MRKRRERRQKDWLQLFKPLTRIVVSEYAERGKDGGKKMRNLRGGRIGDGRESGRKISGGKNAG